MIKTVRIPDDVWEKFRSRHGNENESTKALEALAIKYQDVDPTDRILVLPQKQRQELEKLFERHFETPEALVEAVRQHLALHFEGLDVALSPHQLQRVNAQATFQNKPVGDVLRGLIEHTIVQLGY